MAGKIGVVTGAGGDIGVAVCEKLGEREARILCVDLDEQSAKRGAEACRKAGGEAETFVADVTDEKQVFAYASRCQELWGSAHFFFNNAGIEGDESPLASYHVDTWDRVLSVNLRGVFLGMKAMVHLLEHEDVTRIVNTASVAGMIATPHLAAYGASKHAVIGLTKTAAVEFAPHGIAVNAICPGPVDSQMMRRIETGVGGGAAEAAKSQYEQIIPFHRYAALDEVASLATYLLLDSPVYMTGQAIALDGGMSVS
ncbi:MAG: SDR family NAD(P)-dependent oxidoreductase [Dehalococcoidia bacterium]|nr:SDR family NAD(P)-dependent oxidoreductase [Dehalococcoidia bacterium]